MAKAILIMDMPESCSKCKFFCMSFRVSRNASL